MMIELQSACALRLHAVHVHILSALANHKDRRAGDDDNDTNVMFFCLFQCTSQANEHESRMRRQVHGRELVHQAD